VSTRRDPHEQERGDVGERTEQDQQHRAGKQPELLGGTVHYGIAEWIGGEPRDAVPEAGAPERIDALADSGQIAGGVGEADLRFEPPDAAEPERPAPGGRGGLEHRPDRGPHPGELVAVGRQDADDRVALAVERKGAADRRPDTAEALRRQFRRDHHDGGRALGLIVRLDEAPGSRHDAERAEEPGADPRDRDLLRLPTAGQARDAQPGRAEGIEAPLLLANGLDVHHAEGPAVGGRVLLVHPHQSVGVGVRQVAQEHRAHHTEHRGRGTDRQREHEDRSGGEPGIAPEAAQAEANVGGEIVERAHAARVERGLAALLDTAEREQGRPAGGRGVGAGPDTRRLVPLEMKADLLVQIALPPALEEQRPEAL